MAANTGKRNPSGVKEFFRKTMVSLKRQPQTLPLIALVIAFLVYSLKLKNISDTTARINSPGMGFAGFVTMLFSILAFVAFLNAFPRHKKPVLPLLGLVIAMLGIMIACDEFYIGRIVNALNRAESPIKLENKTIFIYRAYQQLNTHVVILAIAIGLIVLLPVYSKLLRKVKTSIDVAANDNIDTIELSQDE
ncbi:MAG: hypothetical protein K5696_09315 [Lachnospiraceae bacterium]|nr:hypothetical protein [Lachnospiraceae bacterium]